MDQIQLEQIISEFRKALKENVSDVDTKLRPIQDQSLNIISKLERFDERTAMLQDALVSLTKFREEALPIFLEFHEYKRTRESLPQRLTDVESSICKLVEGHNKEQTERVTKIERENAEQIIRFENHCREHINENSDDRISALERTFQQLKGGEYVLVALQGIILLALAIAKFYPDVFK